MIIDQDDLIHSPDSLQPLCTKRTSLFVFRITTMYSMMATRTNFVGKFQL